MTQGSQPELGKLIPHLGVKADQPSGEGIGRAVKPLGLSAGDTLEAVNGAPSHVPHHAALAAQLLKPRRLPRESFDIKTVLMTSTPATQSRPPPFILPLLT